MLDVVAVDVIAVTPSPRTLNFSTYVAGEGAEL
jgi:hypothetical protein